MKRKHKNKQTDIRTLYRKKKKRVKVAARATVIKKKRKFLVSANTDIHTYTPHIRLIIHTGHAPPPPLLQFGVNGWMDGGATGWLCGKSKSLTRN